MAGGRPIMRYLSIRYLPLLLLLYITFFALIPWQPQGPFDARDWSIPEGVSVAMPWWQLFLEPFSALGNILTGAPDFRLAGASFALWAALISGLWIFWRRPHLVLWRRTLWATAVSLFAFWCIPAMMLLFSHLHFPGWQLKVERPDWLAADLQSHTLGSHDALIRAAYSLKWHRQRGYDVLAVTEHNDPAGSFYAQGLSERMKAGPLVIPGIEVANEYDGFLLGLGLKPGIKLGGGDKNQSGYSRHFIEQVDREHQGAVISLAWRLKAADVAELAAAGVHAFELMNAGHPDIPDSVRNEMLRLEREGQVRLVSSSDWHGWGGNARTWTLLRVPGAEKLSRRQQADTIVQLLRSGSAADVVPLVAGYQGDTSPWRTIFSPVVELARYAAELSPLRLLGWWLWALLLWQFARVLRSRGIAPVRTLWGGYLLLVAALLIWRGIALYTIREEGDVVLSRVTGELGMMAVYAALPLLLVGGGLLYGVLRRRGVKR